MITGVAERGLGSRFPRAWDDDAHFRRRQLQPRVRLTIGPAGPCRAARAHVPCSITSSCHFLIPPPNYFLNVKKRDISNMQILEPSRPILKCEHLPSAQTGSRASRQALRAQPAYVCERACVSMRVHAGGRGSLGSPSICDSAYALMAHRSNVCYPFSFCLCTECLCPSHPPQRSHRTGLAAIHV